jgi:hypothetical protein
MTASKRTITATDDALASADPEPGAATVTVATALG